MPSILISGGLVRTKPGVWQQGGEQLGSQTAVKPQPARSVRRLGGLGGA